MSARLRVRPAEHGQATVEVALLLPFLLGVIVAALWLARIGSEQVSLISGARAAGRVAAVDSSDAAIRAALENGSGLSPDRLQLVTLRSGDLVTVTVHYRSPTRVPLLGKNLVERTLTAKATFLIEPNQVHRDDALCSSPSCVSGDGPGP